MDLQSYQGFKHSSFSGLIGVAQVDITPPVGIYSRNWGAATHDVAEGIHQPLVLTCMTFQSSQQEKPLVLVAVDLGGWKNSTDERIFRNKLLTALAIEPTQLMVCLSHTHAGPIFSRDYSTKPGGEYMDSILITSRNLLSWHPGMPSFVRFLQCSPGITEPVNWPPIAIYPI